MTLVLSPSEIISKLEKKGELGLLGKAPRWNRRLLGELTNVQNGAPFSSDKFNREGLGMPLIRIRDVGASETSTYFDGEYDPAYVVRAGDLLVGMDGDFRCAKWTSGDALLNQRVCRLKVISAELDERFLFLILQGYLDAIWRETSATTVKHLSSKSIQQIPIPLPSMKEQRKIVELLEDHLSHLDAALADVKQAKFKAAQFRRSLLQSAFTGNLIGDGTHLMTTPNHWEISPLSKVVDVLDNLRVPVNSSERNKRPGSVPYYGATGQVGTIDEALFNEELLILGEDGVQFFDPNKPKAYKISGPAWVNNHAHVLRPKPEKVLQNFLLHFLNQFNYIGYANGTTRLKLTQGAMNSIPVHLPPLPEQQKIVEILEDHLSRLDASVAIADAMEKQSASLRRSLLQAAFTGQLTKEVASV
jgi:type I restriction enzyme S subunit